MKRLPLLLGFILLAASLVPSCGSKTDSADGKSSGGKDSASVSRTGATGKKKKRKKRERTTSVRAARVLRTDLVLPIVAEGTVRARHSAAIKSEVAGRITRVFVDEGRKVSKGAIIATIDSREYEVAAEEAWANYLQALSRLAVEGDTLGFSDATTSLDEKLGELNELEKRSAGNKADRMRKELALDMKALRDGTYRVDIAAARSGLSAARTALERARLNLDKTKIRAPFTGVVTGLGVSEGEQVVNGTLICNLVNNTDLEADVGVLESDMAHLRRRNPALLVVPSLQDTLRVQVDVISPEFDRTSRTCKVLLRFYSKDGRVRPGMFVRAIIAGETYPDRLLVPKEAVLIRDGRPLVFKVEDKRSKWLYIRPGLKNDYAVEIERVLQGGRLEPGDLVVVSNHLTLSHDARVKVKKVVPFPDPWRSRDEDH